MVLTRGPKIQLVIQNKHLEMQNTVQAKMSENNKQKNLLTREIWDFLCSP